MISSIYPKELKLNKANNSDTSTAFPDSDLSIENGKIPSKIYEKRDNFKFDMINLPCLDSDVPCSTSYGVYISQSIRFARACSSMDDLYERYQISTEKLLKQGCTRVVPVNHRLI